MQTFREPPQVAISLLNTFLNDKAHAGMVGDLVEEFQGGRSAAWFWWQVFGTLAAFAVAGIRQQPGRVVLAALAGSAVMEVSQMGLPFGVFAVERSYPWVGSWNVPIFLAVLPLLGFAFAVAGGYVAGIIGSASRRNSLAGPLGMAGLALCAVMIGLYLLRGYPGQFRWTMVLGKSLGTLVRIACMQVGGYFAARRVVGQAQRLD